MDKQQIIDYIMHTPSNTNPAVLGSMLDTFAGDGSGGVNLHTATLTFVGSSDTATIALSPYLNESTGYLNVNYEAPLIGSYVLPLYDVEGSGGDYQADIRNGGERLSMTSSGGVTIREEEETDTETGGYKYCVYITGDGTITLT